MIGVDNDDLEKAKALRDIPQRLKHCAQRARSVHSLGSAYRLLQLFGCFGNLPYAVSAYVLVLELTNIVGIAAEHTIRSILLENDFLAVYIYLHRVLLGDPQSSSQLDWEYTRPSSSTFLTIPVDFM